MRKILILLAAMNLSAAARADAAQDATWQDCQNGFGPIGIEACTRAIAQDLHTADAHFLRAGRYYLLGKYDQALADYDAAIAKGASRLPVAYNNRANVLSDMGESARAFADYASALKLEPNSAIFRTNRATLYLNIGDNERAIADLNLAIAREPNSGLAFARRGSAYLKRGDYDRAIKDLKTGLEKQPELNWAADALDEALAARDAAGLRKSIADRRVAIVFGNAQYPFIGNLANAGHDAREIAKALHARGYDIVGPQGGPYLDLTKAQMEQALDRFQREAGTAKAALVWYAGHGSSFKIDDKQRENFLLPIEFRSKDAKDILTKGVALERVKRATLPAAGLRILIIDACRDNNVESDSRGVKRGFQIEGRNSDIVVMFSTQPGAQADDGDGDLSPFAQGFLAELNTNAAQPLPLFLSAVAGRVKALTKAEQIPEVFTSLTDPKLTLIK